MDVLILGGTGFLGRHLVEAALGEGHRVTLFNRGLREPGLFHEVEKIKGDREADLSALLGRRWDAAIDTCGYVPRVVRGVSEEFLEDNGVEPFTELPLWLPREYAGLQAIDCTKAIAAGLAFRPLSQTITDVLEWDHTRGKDKQPAAGLGPERERELLLAWQGATL